MSNHEVHLFCPATSDKLVRLQALLPDLRPNLHCDPANIPPGSICYEYPSGREREFEAAAANENLNYNWGIGATFNVLCCAAVGDYLYAGVNEGGSDNKLYIWDITDPEVPDRTGFTPLALAAQPTDIAVHSGLCYVTTANTILTINIDDPASPTLETTDTQSGNNWTRILVIGDTVWASGDSIGHIEPDSDDPDVPFVFGLESEPADVTAGIAIQGRRLFAVSSTTGFLRSFRIGGVYCAWISAGSLKADVISAELLRARHAYFKGEVVASGITILNGVSEEDQGALALTNYIHLGSIFIFWGTGDPNTVFTAPAGSTFHRTDGGAGTSFYVNEDGTNTGWVGK